jgi:hypothetical protein
VAKYSPPLADKVAVSSSAGINAVLRSLVKKIKPNPDPLVIAKEYLTGLGVETPPISDEWWLDMIEYKEVLKYPDTNSNMRWIFPLPFSGDERGYERGIDIAAAALQSDWSFEGEELDIGPTTHPEEVHAFLRRWPGLLETARYHPDVTALYVPQITIPGFDQGFEDVFDELLGAKRVDYLGGYGGPETIDGKTPLCPDVVALRHPTFGNYFPYDLGRWYFDAHTMQYIRSSTELFDGLIWLLSPGADWMPAKVRTMLIEGIIVRDSWLRDIRPINSENRFLEILYDDERSKFILTPEVRHDLLILVMTSLDNVGVEADGEAVLEHLLETDFIMKYFDFIEMVRERRRQRSIKD